MKHILFALIAAASISAMAGTTTPIDREVETIIIQSPTLEGKFFCGYDGKIIDAAVYVCSSQGYSQTQILERAMVNQFGQPCWVVEPKGSGTYLDFSRTDLVLTRVKCSRNKIVPPDGHADPTPVQPVPKP